VDDSNHACPFASWVIDVEEKNAGNLHEIHMFTSFTMLFTGEKSVGSKFKAQPNKADVYPQVSIILLESQPSQSC
jgi:hypothetical protein